MKWRITVKNSPAADRLKLPPITLDVAWVSLLDEALMEHSDGRRLVFDAADIVSIVPEPS